MLGEDEERDLLHLTSGHVCADLGPSIPERIAEQIARVPEAIAMASSGGTMTYAQLGAAADAVAHDLAPHVRSGDLVPVLSDGGPETAVAWLGVLCAGAAFVPIDVRWPGARIESIVAHLDAHAMIVAGRCLVPDGLTVPIVRVDSTRRGPRRPPARLSPRQPIYAFFTSGSTGVPKAAVVHHGGIQNRFSWMTRTFGVDAAAGVLQTTRHVYDSAVWQLLWPLTLGGRVVVPDPDQDLSAPEVLRFIETYAVSMIDFVPSLFDSLAPALIHDSAHLTTLRTIIIGGEEMTVAAVKRFVAACPAIRVFNAYGPTEASIGCVFHEVTGREEGRIPIGRPITNVRIEVLDAGGARVPIGVEGEIHIGGVCVGLGYAGAAALTANSFVPDPWAPDPGARLYRTGDRGRVRPDGEIDFLGRDDSQIKLRGFRIELEEIEAALRDHPQVREAVVVPLGGPQGHQRLGAYVGGVAAPNDLRAHLKRLLPRHMIPDAMQVMEALPRLPNGKLNRHALTTDVRAFTASYVAPRTEHERALCEEVADVLGLDAPVGIEDDFFELGGHSLLAAQLVARVRSRLGIELSIRAVFDTATIAGLAERLRSEPATAVPSLVPTNRPGRLPLSFAQQRLWFVHQLHPESAAYHVSGTTRIEGPLDPGLIENAFATLIGRHEALRATFHTSDDGPFQTIHASIPFAVGVTHVVNVTEALVAAGAATAIPFDLERGPLIRVHLYAVSATEHVVLVCVHHIVCDGWSLAVLEREFAECYAALATGTVPTLAHQTLRYPDYLVWEHSTASRVPLEAELAYWQERLAGAPMLDLPTDRPRPTVLGDRGAEVLFDVDPETTSIIRALCRGHGVTPYMVLLAAFQVLLSRYARESDVSIGAPVANRPAAELEGVIGFFINMVVLRTYIDEAQSTRELLTRVRETVLEAFAHKSVPFERVVRSMQPQRDLARAPLFQTMFILQNVPRTALRFGGLQLTPVLLPCTSAQYDLALSVEESDGLFRNRLQYATELFDRPTIEAMARTYQTLLRAMVREPDEIVERIDIGPSRRMQGSAPTGEATFVSMFASQRARTPEAFAASYGASTLSYEELDARSNQLARYLQVRGSARETRVALLLDRSVDLLVALIAIAKSGAAFVPLDPTHPPSRLQFMLHDSGVAIVVTRERILHELGVKTPCVVCVDTAADEISGESDAPLSISPAPGDLAYVISTSGSTGPPKGVLIEHGAVATLLTSMREIVGIGPADRWLALAAISFDMVIVEMLLPVISGAEVVIGRREIAWDGERLASCLEENQITILQATPATWRLLVDAGWSGHVKALCGGEALPIGLARDLLERCDLLLNLYGPTETTVWSTCVRVDDELLSRASTSVPLGAPIAGAMLQVLDKWRRPVPDGAPGELYIGGPCVARGYLDRPALTREKFIQLPGVEGRWYATGDIVRRRADGTLNFLGRADDQLKVRGYRVEPGEIEHHLVAHPDVREALVVAHELRPGDTRLVAYVVPTPGATDQLALRLRAHLKDRVPYYMVPQAVTLVADIPRTSHQKIDRRALLQLPLGRPELEVGFETPSTGLEAQVAAIWKDALGIDRIGKHDNFFDLGGHSLLAAQITSRIRRILGVAFPLRNFLLTPTVSAVAEQLRAMLDFEAGGRG